VTKNQSSNHKQIEPITQGQVELQKPKTVNQNQKRDTFSNKMFPESEKLLVGSNTEEDSIEPRPDGVNDNQPEFQDLFIEGRSMTMQ